MCSWIWIYVHVDMYTKYTYVCMYTLFKVYRTNVLYSFDIFHSVTSFACSICLSGRLSLYRSATAIEFRFWIWIFLFLLYFEQPQKKWKEKHWRWCYCVIFSHLQKNTHTKFILKQQNLVYNKNVLAVCLSVRQYWH